MVSFFPPPCPQIPEFRSLLVTGYYHASAPIHFLLSHAAANSEARAIMLTPDRESFKNPLIELNDQWIDSESGTGTTYAAARRVQLYYPPTLAHARMLLAMLHEYDDTVHHAKTTLELAPTLLVLNEVSAYLDAQATQATVSAYLSVVSAALALATSWSSRSSTTSQIAIFDSGLDALKLPILRSLSFEEPGDSEANQRDALLVLLERYIEWKAEFVEEDEIYTVDHAERDVPVRKLLKIYRINNDLKAELEDEHGDGGQQPSDIVWTWSETVVVDDEGRERTMFAV